MLLYATAQVLCITVTLSLCSGQVLNGANDFLNACRFFAALRMTHFGVGFFQDAELDKSDRCDYGVGEFSCVEGKLLVALEFGARDAGERDLWFGDGTYEICLANR